MIDKSKLIIPKEDFISAFPVLNFNNKYEFDIYTEQLFISDPILLSDIYHSNDQVSLFLRSNACFLMDFGGDIDTQVLYNHPFIYLPICNDSVNNYFINHENTSILSKRIISDSGSLIFLPITNSITSQLQAIIDTIITENNGSIVNLHNGHWKLFYEQWPSSAPNLIALNRNIVIQYITA